MSDMHRHDNRNAPSVTHTEIITASTSIGLWNTSEPSLDLEMRYHAGSASATVIRRHQSAAVII